MIPSDWIFGLLGGLMIGSAAALFLLMNGRIMGASGLLGGVLDRSAITTERLAFLTGLIAMPALLAPAIGATDTNVTTSPLLLVLAGLAVGLGTRMANGCTSGHGVCGISRFSVRGIVATLIYVGAGFVTMLVGRHLLGAF